ncbi:MAG TPA: tripartite tricarboxylate transporter TctB family protein [Hyphomicrobiaceae bacterium]|jgi:hypothetical protein
MHAIGRTAPFIVLFCAALYLFTLTRQFEYPHAPERLGPDIWPQILLVLLMLACIIGFVGNLRRPQPPSQRPDAPASMPGDAVSDEPDAPPRYSLVAGGMLLFLAYPVALEYVGFLLATFLLMALFMWIGQWRNLLGVTAASALGTLCLFYLFRGVVYVSLPLGVEPFRSATLWIADAMGMH